MGIRKLPKVAMPLEAVPKSCALIRDLLIPRDYKSIKNRNNRINHKIVCTNYCTKSRVVCMINTILYNNTYKNIKIGITEYISHKSIQFKIIYCFQIYMTRYKKGTSLSQKIRYYIYFPIPLCMATISNSYIDLISFLIYFFFNFFPYLDIFTSTRLLVDNLTCIFSNATWFGSCALWGVQT